MREFREIWCQKTRLVVKYIRLIEMCNMGGARSEISSSRKKRYCQFVKQSIPTAVLSQASGGDEQPVRPCRLSNVVSLYVTMLMLSWILYRLQAKYSRLFNLGDMSGFNQHNAVQWIWIPFRLQVHKDVHLCFILTPGKMIFAVLELWLSPLQWVLNW